MCHSMTISIPGQLFPKQGVMKEKHNREAVNEI